MLNVKTSAKGTTSITRNNIAKYNPHVRYNGNSFNPFLNISKLNIGNPKTLSNLSFINFREYPSVKIAGIIAIKPTIAATISNVIITVFGVSLSIYDTILPAIAGSTNKST